MEDDAPSSARADREVKGEDEAGDVRMTDSKPTYKSWKKKYRKMRIKFEKIMQDGEDLYLQEQRGLKRAKELAIENDRLLDMLLDMNNSHQWPTDKRIDVRLDVSDDEKLDIDGKDISGPHPQKSLKGLLQDIPHLDFDAVSARFPEQVADLLVGTESPAADAAHQQHPPAFLTGDDIDNYIYLVDLQNEAKAKDRGEEFDMLPTLAPLARDGTAVVANGSSAALDAGASGTGRDAVLRNPTSVYNWLRKNAPKTFLQDGEHAAADKENGHDDDHGRSTSRAGRKSGVERGSGSTRGGRSSKRSSAAHGRGKRHSMDESMDYDEDMSFEVSTPTTVTGGGKGKRKRQVDDDPGYRPKGGSSRPTKKKRKSVGGDGDFPTPSTGKRGSRKSNASIVADDTGGLDD